VSILSSGSVHLLSPTYAAGSTHPDRPLSLQHLESVRQYHCAAAKLFIMSGHDKYNTEGVFADTEGYGSSTNPELDLTSTHDQLARGLKSRHIQFLALGKSHSFYARNDGPLLTRLM
jgi:hypothetical protein